MGLARDRFRLGLSRYAEADFLPDRGLWIAPENLLLIDGDSAFFDARLDGLRDVALPVGRSDRAVTEVEGRRIAAIIHDPALLDDIGQVRAAGAAAALALANERLEAELRAKVEQLSISRTRIVESGDAARRRIERDLHDGAQQRLVSLALRLGITTVRAAIPLQAVVA